MVPAAAPNDERAHSAVAVYAIDDHPAFLATVGLVVGATPGFELIGTATSAAAALEALAVGADPADDADLILVDVVMPGDNGLEFVRRYRERGGRAAIILMSSYEPADLPLGAVEPAGMPVRIPTLFLAKNELSPDVLATMWGRVAANESPSGR